MSKGALGHLLQDLHRIAGIDALRDHGDADLLARFALDREEAAFATLVWRHGGLVFGVCKRMLPSEQDAEDAFQATFLTLARKAGSISRKEALAAWLYRVAYRIALRARKKTPSHLHDTAALAQLPARAAGNDLESREILRCLDDEIAQLPTSSARAIILCYFEGKTHEEAALVLGCPKGTLASWIARARQQLHERLTQRGCALSAAGLATLLAGQASAAPTTWITPTTKAALAFAAGSTAATGLLSTNAVVLSEGVLRMIWFNQLKMFAAVAVLLAAFGVGTSYLATTVWGSGPDAPAQGDAQAEIAKLRDEITKLRGELKEAVKEIKSLKEALPDKEANATYQGKSTSFWLGQLKDADPKFRADAIEALGVLALNNKKLVPVLIGTLQENPGDWPAARAIQAVRKQGPEALPALIKIAKDKSQDLPKFTRQNAIQVIGAMKSDAKPAVPILAEILNETQSIGTCANSVRALHSIGPDAKEAIPELVELLERSLRDIGKKKGEYVFGDRSLFEIGPIGGINVTVLDALEHIEPSIRDIIPSKRELGIDDSPKGRKKGGPGGIPFPGNETKTVSEDQWRNAVGQWQKMATVLKKKFPSP